ncbi:hypothetical protein KW786_00575 [Candidatus Parcubacteria bacterium]|nr:hypothetical protein [Candidatus Parcubacteria bacterium]
MAASDLFFFLKPITRIFWGCLWWGALMLVVLIIPFLRIWWWFLFPLFLSIELRTLYLWWIAWDHSYANKKWTVLEVVPPKEVLTPLKAMEDVFAIMWGPLYDDPNWREKWAEGTLTDAPGWMSWEIASIEGRLHFYLRVPSSQKGILETALYGHYPELEIAEVPDYTKNVPQNLPNKEWNIYGEDFLLGKSQHIPLKTYEKFFEPQGEKISAEEKRLDPISALLELMAKLGPGEQFWLQFITFPITDKYNPELKNGAEAEIAKITKRPLKQVKTLWSHVQEMFFHLVYGPQKEGAGEKASYKWLETGVTESGDREMVLSPGERELLTEIENKIKKPMFRVGMRGMYVAKNENFSAANKLISRIYFSRFANSTYNHIKFSILTRPKTKFLFRKTIPLIRVKRMFRNYILRFTPMFPDRKSEMSLMNPEELTTLFHFPLKITGLVSPTMVRVESKKGGPPPNLPM